MNPSLWLRRFSMPLDQAWQAEQTTQLSDSELARLDRIARPQRRAQFVVAHQMLRESLGSAVLGDVRIDVDSGGRLQVRASAPVYASIAHSNDCVAVLVADEAVGVDVESVTHKRELGGAAAMLGLSLGTPPEAVLRAWMTAEARLKAGGNASQQVWISSWQSCQLAVAGLAKPPLTGVFDGLAGIYNPTELKWDAV